MARGVCEPLLPVLLGNSLGPRGMQRTQRSHVLRGRRGRGTPCGSHTRQAGGKWSRWRSRRGWRSRSRRGWRGAGCSVLQEDRANGCAQSQVRYTRIYADLHHPWLPYFAKSIITYIGNPAWGRFTSLMQVLL